MKRNENICTYIPAAQAIYVGTDLIYIFFLLFKA